jgi:hypothetical protein
MGKRLLNRKACSSTSIGQVTTELFEILAASPKTQNRIMTCLVDTTLQAQSEKEALEKLATFHSVNVPVAHLERLREGALRPGIFGNPNTLLSKLNELLSKHGLGTVSPPKAIGGHMVLDDEAPF